MEREFNLKPLRTCAICQTEYDYCSSCPEKSKDPLWKNSFCSENCKKIYEICVSYNLKEISKEEAQKRLASCDLSHKDKYTKSTKRILNEIMEGSPKPKPKTEIKK